MFPSASPLLYQALFPRCLLNLSSSYHFFQPFAFCPLNYWTASPPSIPILCLISESFKIRCKLLMSLLCSRFFRGSLCPKRGVRHPQHCRKAFCNPALPAPVVSSTAPPHLMIIYAVVEGATCISSIPLDNSISFAWKALSSLSHPSKPILCML